MTPASPGRSPTKGDRTRAHLVDAAMPVFNRQGFAGTSMRDLCDATGMEKGGIYNHFPSKEALALAALDHAVELVTAVYRDAQADASSPLAALDAVIVAFASDAAHAFDGGCPIFNTAIDADDTNPELLERARAAMTSWHRLIGSLVKAAKSEGEMPAEVNPYELATVVTSSLEGALVLSRMYDDPVHLDRIVMHLRAHIRTLTSAAPTPARIEGTVK